MTLCPEGLVCPTFYNFLALGLYTFAAVIFVVLWTQRRYKWSWRGLRGAVARTLSFLRCSETEQFEREYAEVRQKYGEVCTLAMLLTHITISPWLAVIPLLMHIPTASRWWYSVWVVFGLWLTLLVALPNLHTVRGLPLGYIVGIIVMSMHQAAVDNWTKEAIMMSNSLIILGVVIMAPLGGILPSLLGCLACSVFTSYSYAHAAGNPEMTVRMFVGWQMSLGLGIMVLGGLCNNMFIFYCVHVSVERKATLAEREAVSSLLDIVCDAVAELDDSGRIMSPAQSLSNLLLLPGSHSLQGTQLQQLLHKDEDRQILEDCLSEQEQRKGATMRHLDMRDSWGSPVRMELFQVSFSGRNSKAKYLIGIKEHTDFVRSPRQPAGEQGLATQAGSKDQFLDPSQESFTEFSSWESFSGSAVGRAEERFLEGGMPTSARAVEMSLISTMETWRMGRGSKAVGFCCPLHAAVDRMTVASKRLKNKHCLPRFKTSFGSQCGQCGIEDGDYINDHGQCMICLGIEHYLPSLAERTGADRGNRRSRVPRSVGAPAVPDGRAHAGPVRSEEPGTRSGGAPGPRTSL